MKDYLLAYVNAAGETMAAVPDIEGVYINSIKFSEYKGPITPCEVVILEINNFHQVLATGDEDDFLEGEIIGKMLLSADVSVCIEKIGFKKFFTTLIKKFMERGLQ